MTETPAARSSAPTADKGLLRNGVIAVLTLSAIALHLALRWSSVPPAFVNVPLLVAIAAGGLPLVVGLAQRVLQAEFGSDLLAGVAIVTAVILGEFLAASVIVLMLSGGQALERLATRRASSVLDALARRSPTVAHRQQGGQLVDVPVDAVTPGDVVVILPHETCPADGTVQAGSSTMDESYLTGEPFLLRKTVGSAVISGAINGTSALTIRVDRPAADSRYARIMEVVRAAELHRPPMRRMADRLGAWYTPAALAIAAGSWLWSGSPDRFLAVVVIATPCPLLLAIPVAIVGAISLAARRSIVVRDPALLERVSTCRTVILDKTGTLTLGRPVLASIDCVPGERRDDVLQAAASLEQYSRHPLAGAVLDAADRAGLVRLEATDVEERPGTGLSGHIGERSIRIVGRGHVNAELSASLPPEVAGLECVVLIDGRVAATLRFRDEPRRESRSFVNHLGPRHHIDRLLLVSGDRASEVRYLADVVGIKDVYAGQTPEQKLAIVRAERKRQPCLFVGDGVNDAPAMLAATAGVALGANTDVTAAAAGAVILEYSLTRVDELLHIGRRMTRIARQSALGGMALSAIGMIVAAAGWLTPIGGALLQEAIDIGAILNALRAARAPASLIDFEPPADETPKIPV